MAGVSQIISNFTINASGSNSIEKWTQTGQNIFHLYIVYKTQAQNILHKRFKT